MSAMPRTFRIFPSPLEGQGRGGGFIPLFPPPFTGEGEGEGLNCEREPALSLALSRERVRGNFFEGPMKHLLPLRHARLFTCLVVIGLLLAPGFRSAHAAFRDPLWTARSAALGGAFTAVNGDPTSVFYNPATAVHMTRPAANFTYAKLFAGLDEVNLSLNQFAYARPLKSFSVVTVGWGSVNASGLRREDTAILGFSHLFRDTGGLGEIAVGVSGRYLSQSFTLDARTVGDPVFKNGRTRGDFALDLHAFLPVVSALSENLAAGLSLRAVNRPDVGFSSKDRLPMESVLGVLYKWKNFAFPVDLVHRGGELTPEMGAEASFVENRFALRLGTDTDQVGAGLGYRRTLSPRLALSFDYAFLWPLKIEGTSGSHRATIGVSF